MPMSLSLISSVRLTMVAPQARAIRRLSVFRMRLMAVMFAFTRKCCAKSMQAQRRVRKDGYSKDECTMYMMKKRIRTEERWKNKWRKTTHQKRPFL